MSEEKKSIYELLEADITNSDLSEAEKAAKLSRLIQVRSKQVNIMLVGATGSGKSSTVNAMFNMNVAKVGVGVGPETSCISKFVLDNLTIWDTPGLGDGVERDKVITRDIINKLNELGEDGNPIIDLVVVIMDSSSKDLGTSYDLINNVLIPCLGKEAHKRIIIGLNQADIAMKGNHWNKAENKPDDVLNAFLKKKAASVRARIKEGTGLDLEPICYCAGYSEEGEAQSKPYNLTKLLHSIIQIIPREKRLVLVDNLNTNKENWKHDDEEEDYGEDTEYVVIDTVFDFIEGGSEFGGKVLGIPGKLVGGVAGAIAGTVAGIFKSIFG
ncbi:MAG: 50S ribosome-binding GTPase [Phascolarctobacterium sp.]|nr:50S ribosome-binding GTPase [Phascolarctobacterium sp.]